MDINTNENTNDNMNIDTNINMEINTIYNEDCLKTMEKMDEHSIDVVLTSPPYCTSNRAGKNSKTTLLNSNARYYPSLRYDVFLDNLTPSEYIDWTIKIFNGFDRVLKNNGCVIYNISYSSDNRDMLFRTVSAILERTNFSMSDMIGWKKRSALPNNTSSNKLTRIFEPVFVFARKDEIDTFICNKKVVSVRERTGQKMYENVFNFIDAPNNDGTCKLNKATYSSELCEKLLGIYAKSGMTVYDPFMGTGTTAVACKRLNMNYIGSELSSAQIEFAKERIEHCLENTSKKKRSGKKSKSNDAVVNKRFVQLELFDENISGNNSTNECDSIDEVEKIM